MQSNQIMFSSRIFMGKLLCFEMVRTFYNFKTTLLITIKNYQLRPGFPKHFDHFCYPCPVLNKVSFILGVYTYLQEGGTLHLSNYQVRTSILQQAYMNNKTECPNSCQVLSQVFIEFHFTNLKTKVVALMCLRS